MKNSNQYILLYVVQYYYNINGIEVQRVTYNYKQIEYDSMINFEYTNLTIKLLRK